MKITISAPFLIYFSFPRVDKLNPKKVTISHLMVQVKEITYSKNPNFLKICGNNFRRNLFSLLVLIVRVGVLPKISF